MVVVAMAANQNENSVKRIQTTADISPLTLTGAISLRVGSGVSEDFLFRRGGATGIDNSPFGGSGGFILDCITIA